MQYGIGYIFTNVVFDFLKSKEKQKTYEQKVSGRKIKVTIEEIKEESKNEPQHQ